MVGSTFIQTNRGDHRTLINTAQVVSIYTKDIELASKGGMIEYRRYSIELGTIYTIQVMLTSRREMEYVFATAAERDELYNQMVQAIAPAVSIENNAPIVPELTEEREKLPYKPAFPNAVFANEDEYNNAVARVMRDIISGKMLVRALEPEATPPTPKPPRKPYTRKPRQ
jgi:hypothetical protein